MHTRTAITASALALIAATAGLLIAGPLHPPGGAIGSATETPSELEPRTTLHTPNHYPNTPGVIAPGLPALTLPPRSAPQRQQDVFEI